MSKILDFRNPKSAPRSPLLPEDKHTRRVLLLAFAFFLSGLVFFATRMNASREALSIPAPIEQEAQPVAAAPKSRLANLPPPASFTMFQYHTGMPSIAATTTCADQYAVVMLYQSGTDYRADPQSALYNAAIPCSTGKESVATIALTDKPLTDGNRYYIVRAQQGSGTWYNPY